MKRSFEWYLMTFLVVSTTGCGIYQAPDLVDTPQINTASVQRRLLTTVETLHEDYPTYIFSIAPLVDGFEVSTSSSVQMIDSDGRGMSIARLDLPDDDVVFPLVRSWDDSGLTVFTGSVDRSLLMFDGSGRRIGEAPGCYPTDLLMADVEGDEQPEVICAGGYIGRTLRIHRTDGSQLRTIELGETVTGLGAIDVDGDGKDEIIAYTYPSGKGMGRFRVLSGDRVIADWKVKAVCRFSVAKMESGQALVMQEESAFTVRDVDGNLLHRFEDPNLSTRGFCRPMGTQLPDGRWFFVASGKGGFNYHLVALFSDSGLVYSEIRSGHSFALLPIRDETGFAMLVGAGPEIWKYSLP